MRVITVSKEEAGRRADKFLMKYLIRAPRPFVYKTLRKKNLKINGEVAHGGEVLSAGDVINLYLSEDTINNFAKGGERAKKTLTKNNPAALKIIYEDENILICDKPAGLLSQPAVSLGEDSLVVRIAGHMKKNGEYDPEKNFTFAPAIINRLDRNTSGLVLAAKNLIAARAAAKLLRERKITRTYLAIVAGEVKRAGRLEDGYIKDEKSNTGVVANDSRAKDVIITEYKPLSVSQGGATSVIEVNLITGKSHQIRAHMKDAGHPVVGDPKYGEKKINERARKDFNIRRQMLHAWKLTFDFGGDGSDDGSPLLYLSGKTFRAEPPEDMRALTAPRTRRSPSR